MKLNLFSCSTGGYLLAPECMLASAAAQALHGPVHEHLGVIDSHLLPTTVREQIEDDIDRRDFAYLSQQAGAASLVIRRASGPGMAQRA